MKRFLAFFAVLISVLVIGYLQPVFFPPEKAKINIEDIQRPDVSHTALPHEELPASGYALYIGKKITDFTTKFGEPLTSYDTGFGYELWTFGEEDSEYMEVSVKDNVICAVKAFNTTDDVSPFTLGMTLSEVSDITTIFSNFEIENENMSYSIELMEEDMNYRPLIAFDNNTFAVLFFTHGQDVLSGIVYLSKDYLLTVMPYQLTAGEALPIEINDTEAEIVDQKQKTIMRMINMIRIKEALPAYSIHLSAEKNAESLYQFYEENAAEFLSVERLEALSRVKSESLGEIATSFILTNTEFDSMLSQSELDLRKSQGIFMTPVYDLSFTALYWFSDGAYYSRLSHSENETIGVAFSKEDVLVLLQAAENNTEETEDSR
ncbi:CAP-associated domain-containing protein [uncultured Enterococcus sp.]|uniref:CAP-associated domain-containing protein n=1 Tax=uncultured Enterococcus sp. TaxID=167972 RepID=UPI002AA81D54|nr:CAP-associated domain-containing protein [uncultured Enterococcus sp.]